MPRIARLSRFSMLVSIALATVLTACGDRGPDPLEMVSPPPSDACCPPTEVDWPRFRGVRGDGVVPGAGIEPWATAGPEELWRRPLGPGFSSPSIQGDRLYVSANEGDEELLLALEVETGETLWQQPLGPAFQEEYGDGPRSTPTVDDHGVVYALSSRAVLLAVDGGEGQVLWRHDLHRRFDARGYDRGYSSSPWVLGDLVILNLGPGEGHAVVALNRRDGSVLWAAEDGVAAYGSPLAIERDGETLVVSAIGSGLVALDPDDGSRLWHAPWPTRYGLNIAMPVVFDDGRVLLSSGYDQGAVMVRPTGEAVETLWTQRLFRNHFSSSVAHGDLIFGFDNGTLQCLDATSGESRWGDRGFGKGSLLRVGDTLVVLSERGELALVDATDESFRPLARARVLEGKSWTAPVLAGSRLVLRGERELLALRVDRRSEPDASAEI